jgi:hypothetical protein
MYTVYMLLGAKSGGDPLGKAPLVGMIVVQMQLLPGFDGGFNLHVYDGEKFLGSAVIVWDGLVEHHDPILSASYLKASAHIETDIEEEIAADDTLRDLIIDSLKRSGIRFWSNVLRHDQIREHVISQSRKA